MKKKLQKLSVLLSACIKQSPVFTTHQLLFKSVWFKEFLLILIIGHLQIVLFPKIQK